MYLNIVHQQQTMGWIPSLPETGDRWRPCTNYFPSSSSLTLPPINQKKRPGSANKLKATSHKKWRQMASLQRWLPLILMTYKLQHVFTVGLLARSLAQNLNRDRLELHTTQLIYTTQPLIRLLYRLLGPNFGWKRD